MHHTTRNWLTATVVSAALGMPLAVVAASEEGESPGSKEQAGATDTEQPCGAQGDHDRKRMKMMKMMKHHAMRGGTPTLKVEAKGDERALKFVCNDEMDACLEAFDRVHGALEDD